MSTDAGGFVGRVDHLATVDRVLAEARQGRGGLVAVAGDAGIGKTTFCQTVADRAAVAGASVAWAACWESATTAPLFPWTQLLRQVIGLRPNHVEALGDRRAWIDAVTGPGRPPEDDPDTARVEVAAAVVELLAAAGRQRAQVCVLDDLHWSDEPSLRLLTTVAGALRTMPVVVIVTYREGDVGADRRARLVSALRHATVISLEGLSVDEVGELAATATGHVADAAALHQRSGGNPLFARELLRHGLDRADLPPTVEATLQARMAARSADVQRVLVAGAVVGDEFTVDVVARVTASVPGAVLAALDDAVAARLVVAGSAPGRFRFGHALARAAATTMVGLAERTELHRATGRALEAMRDSGAPVEPAALAHHFAAAIPVGTAAKAVRYSREAADDALRRTAFEDGARLLRQALAALDLAPEAADRAEVLLELGDAERAAGAPARAREAYLAAATIARTGSRVDVLARAALGLGGDGFEVGLADREQIDLLQEALDAMGNSRPGWRARLCGRLSVALTYYDAPDRRRALATEAVALARVADDDEVLAGALAAYCDAVAGPEHVEDRAAAAATVIAAAGRLGHRRLELLGRRLLAVTHLERGDTDAFDAEVDRFDAVATALRQPAYQWLVPLWRAARSGMEGRWAEAEERRMEAASLGRLAASDNAALLVLVQEWCQRSDEGRFDDTLALFAAVEPALVESIAARTSYAWSLAQAGRYDEARTGLDGVARTLTGAPVDAEWVPMLCQVALAVDAVGGHPIAEAAYAALAPFAGQFAVEGIGAWCRGSVHEFLGLLARARGQPGAAADHFHAALVANRATRARVAADRVAGRLAVDATPSVFRPNGDGWELAWGGVTVRVRDRKGLRDLARLLAAPGREIAAADLAGLAVVEVAGDAAVDGTARAAYAARVRQIEADLDALDRKGDADGSRRLTEERDALLAQLGAAFGLRGRARPVQAPAAERARSTVTQRIRDALRHLDREHPAMAAHLRAAVRTGSYCTYEPPEPVRWEL